MKPAPALAWGERGHEIVASMAAEVLNTKGSVKYLKPFEFDLGYYANVPDLIFRHINDKTSKTEGPQHYLDWNETLEKVFKTPENLPAEFAEYKSKLGDQFHRETGLVPWRIHDLMAQCKERVAEYAKEPGETRLGKVLICLGVLSHYTGDISMPLHTTDNHDGQLTGQKGIHRYFENDAVNALDPNLKPAVLKKSLNLYAWFQARKATADQRVRWLIKDSYGHVNELLKLDKKVGRANLTKASAVYKVMITERLAQSVLLTAELWKECLADLKDAGDKDFKYFEGAPAYIEPRYEGK